MSCAGLLAADGLSRTGVLTGRAVKQISFATPDDPRIVYTEFVNASVDSTRARFDRTTVNWVGNLNSPGTRINFTTRASHIRMKVDYLSNTITPGAGIFRMEVDGALQPDLIGSDTDLGVGWYVLSAHAGSTVQREYSVILPYDRDVDFLGLELAGISPELLTPPDRPSTVYVAYGDSITQGFASTSVAAGYPLMVGGLQSMSVINMGFEGRGISPVDGAAVGALGGDLVTVAIGTNDYFANTPATTFSTKYSLFLDSLRALQPAVPIFAITPTWTGVEGTPNAAGLTHDGYRQLIREVVFGRATTDPQLHFIDGSILTPPGAAFFPDGLHPNDAGFGFYATGLGDSNLVADPGFEADAFPWTDTGNSEVVLSNMHSGLKALRVGPGSGGRDQPVGRVRRGVSYTLSAWSKVGAAGESGKLGITFYDASSAVVAEFDVTIDRTDYTQSSLSFKSPALFAYAKVWCSKLAGPSFLYVDDFELLEPGQELSQSAASPDNGTGAEARCRVLHLSGARPNAPAWLLLGIRKAAWPGMIIPVTTNESGDATVRLRIPADVLLPTLHAEWAVEVPGVSRPDGRMFLEVLDSVAIESTPAFNPAPGPHESSEP